MRLDSAVDALQDCLAAEHAACFGYGALGGALAGISSTAVEEQIADAFYLQHRQARDDLIDLINSLGAEPVAAEPSYAVPPTPTARACRRLAVTIEQRAADVYAYAVAETTGDTRSVAADGLTDCAMRAAAWAAPTDPLPGLQ